MFLESTGTKDHWMSPEIFRHQGDSRGMFCIFVLFPLHWFGLCRTGSPADLVWASGISSSLKVFGMMNLWKCHLLCVQQTVFCNDIKLIFLYIYHFYLFFKYLSLLSICFMLLWRRGKRDWIFCLKVATLSCRRSLSVLTLILETLL